MLHSATVPNQFCQSRNLTGVEGRYDKISGYTNTVNRQLISCVSATHRPVILTGLNGQFLER